MIQQMCRSARDASRILALASADEKNACLRQISSLLWKNRAEILEANQADFAAAASGGLAPAMLDRLSLDETRLRGIADSVVDVIALPDPVGQVFDTSQLPSGLRLSKKRVPVGVIAVIYESRPNVTIEVTTLALKTGNAIILRGGSETIATNRLFVSTIHTALKTCGLPPESVQFIDNPDRGLLLELLKMHDTVGMLIPRGGEKLHDFCRQNSTIPVITGGMGICHLFVDKSADQEASLSVIQNAKVQRPSVCNALDTVLVHQDIAPGFLPRLVQHLAASQVLVKAHPNALPFLKGFPPQVVQPAGLEDFDTEWLALTLGVKVVASLDEAIRHIEAHSTGHSDGILTEDQKNAIQFVDRVDSAAVYVNASTRFTDGGQFGLGAEVAVSTQRLHARGPLGLQELTTYKWVAWGDYSVRK